MYNAKYAAKKDALEGQPIDGLIAKQSYYDRGSVRAVVDAARVF